VSTTAGPTLAQIEQLAKIAQSLADAARKQQEYRYAPFLAAFSGMTAGAALFAAGVAFARVMQ
jgi:hypothetical protein